MWRIICSPLVWLVNCEGRETDLRANDFMRSVREAVLLEREDMLARLRSTADLTNELKIAVAVETQRELQRLRDELFKARRNETQKERESSFLQRQLVEAARRIAQLTVESEQLLVDKLSHQPPMMGSDYDV